MSKVSGYLSIIGVIIVWGLSFPLSKLALYYMSPFILTFFRFSIGGVLLLIYARGIVFGKKEAINAILNMSLFVILLNLAINLSSNPALASVLIYTQPIFVVVIIRILGERINLLQLLGVIIAFSGIFISVDSGDFNIGSLIAVLAAILWAIGTVYYRRNLIKESVTKLNAFMSLFSALFALPTIGIDFRFTFNVYGILFAIGVAIIAQAMGFIFWFSSIKNLGPLTSSTMAILVPVSAYVFSFLILGKIPSYFQILGSTLALIGVIISQIGFVRLAK
ncbi:DMT family transporter [Acidianus brierleyi]|uniref:DMT family transporter n=1 Tax=Acidianus brierleyi TaxID=41673 RepID=UPI001FE8D378|nr:DMT family transporter [Acidianus brierleyi]